MFTLYYAPNTCALASHIALVEAGAPYTLKPVDFGKTEQGRQHLQACHCLPICWTQSGWGCCMSWYPTLQLSLCL